MILTNNPAKELFLKLPGKYHIKRTISNHGCGEGIAYFSQINPNELLYKEELNFTYHGYDNQILAVKEYKYIFENNNIIKYFTDKESSLFYKLDFVSNTKAIGSHLCGQDQYNATYIFVNPDSFSLTYEVLGPQKNFNISTIFTRI
ncbi:MAG TPA: DUF6314 family protein [Rickettsia endosymbiont of Pyrocoelia pectoralis]|nr:DUF6314 family protein [Rickettsia endosymbiont of Pyrocoelia pectoralis]